MTTQTYTARRSGDAVRLFQTYREAADFVSQRYESNGDILYITVEYDHNPA